MISSPKKTINKAIINARISLISAFLYAKFIREILILLDMYPDKHESIDYTLHEYIIDYIENLINIIDKYEISKEIL